MLTTTMAISRLLAALAVAGCHLASPVQAAALTSLPGSILIENPSASRPNDLGQTGSRPYAPGITWSSDVPAAFGFRRLYGFQDNGAWYLHPMIGLSQASGTMSLSFDAPVAGVGGYFNYAQAGGAPLGDAPTIAVYDVNHQLLDTFVLDFDTGGVDHSGFFYGFDVGSARISSFEMSGSYIGMTDLRVRAGDTAPNDVPEPGTILLVGAALLAIGGTTRRRAPRTNA